MYITIACCRTGFSLRYKPAANTGVRYIMETFAFVDLVNSDGPIKVVAEISLLTEEEGGRASPIKATYRPNHNFGTEKNREFYIGQIEIPRGDELHPGKTYKLPVTFINGPGLEKMLTVGREWRIQEGAKLVAIAKVVEAIKNA